MGTSVTTLTYDIENRVVGISYPGGGSNSFAYNGDDLRTQKVDSTGTQNYVTDGSSPASAVLKDGNAVYTPGLSERRGSASKFYHGDALGSTRGITDSTQAVTDSQLYDAFGNTVSRTGTTPTPFGFVGKAQYQSDSDSGLQLLGHRYYDPSIGRFLSSDPAKQGTNWYAYCGNNPLKKIDPSGLLWREVGAIAGGIIGGVLGSGAGGIGALPGSAIGTAVGSFIGSLADGNSVSSSAVNGVVDGTVSLIGGAIIGKAIGGIGSLFNCFVAGTLVHMADGTTKPIEEVQAGDKVATKDQYDTAKSSKAGKLSGVGISKVVRTFVHDHAKTLIMHMANGESVTTTPGHPFFVEGKGWTLAGRLAIGNAIVTRAGPATHVVGIEAGKEATVYNFEVEGTHTYFVGKVDGGLWVHNASMFYAVLTLADGTIVGTGSSAARGTLPTFLQGLVDEANNVAIAAGKPVANPGGCAEIKAIINSGLTESQLRGTTITVHTMKGVNKGLIATPCDVCSSVLDRLGINVTPGNWPR